MGGKPFQSKGCKNCKQRKVKCDTQRPGCGNCLKRGIECLGYDKKLVFVYDKSIAQNKRPRDLDRGRAGQITVRTPMALNSASASREQIVASYINLYFPDDISGSTEIDPWFKLISGIVAIPNKTVMLEKAMAATSCIYIGRMNKDNRLLNHGLQLYNGAIHHVSQQLNRSNPYTDELFFTIGIFQILVALYCPHGLDTMVHQTAVTNGIYTQCFYRASNTPIIKTLCVAFQRMRLLKALSPVESNSVLDVALEHTPAAMISHENQPVDELFHLMANIAPIAAAISLTDVSDNEACHQLLYDCLEHRGKLLSWYAENKDSIGGGPYVAKSGDFPSKSISPSEHLFGLPYGFSSLDNARIHVLLWAALSMIQALTGQTYAYAYTSAPVDVNNANKEFQLSEYYADEVSRAMPYCLQDSMKAWGISGTIFGMGQISKVYMELRREEKFLWSQQLFKHSGDIGSDLAYRMGELLQYGWVLLEKADRDQRPELSSLPSTSPGPNSPYSSTTSPASPASSISTTSTASTAPFVAEYAAMQPEVTELPSRIKWTPDH